ncbi:helix-turn-helix domain-containing protein [Bacillus atrophaeus]|uniref:helix-turn-helix domain-containing protein n=1 Tax=Bacillus atrophaeus TaxID=1452 RepID=UPI00228011FC|nr:helix-turn-helix domain-containing protein [Bacillus atrophaeus]MCY7949010.1 helix-turn-helix domain-containing protein [Bacillus atrophaeus]MCY8098501.1 helix-turn-helix domain-containing protein [Bacillus atrophaeus]MCY9170052.1 helix-turn-helix domain-containing protein [Bacillus atrophaeus]MEC0740606.1 helix-turn-helix domain-containing protein [Bacillus atrophaeus]MEC0746958.1 helix-turn-helix domain-containing protein [Bacillus atrophaeus]
MARPSNYDAEGYVHFIEKRTGSTHKIGHGENQRDMPDKEMYEIPFDYIERLNLNKVGNEIPFSMNNVWNVERYMAYYWKQIIGAEAIFVYYQLWEYCDKDNGVDICFPKMSELAERCGISKGSLIDKIKRLEENNFLIQVHRLNKRVNNKEDSPIFKLRRTIPLLSKEQYKKLKPFMRKKHDKYMEEFANNSHLEYYTLKGEEVLNDLIDNYGDRIITSKTRKEIKDTLLSAEAEEYILDNLPENLKNSMMSSKEFSDFLIDNRVYSKPSTEYLFKDTMVVYDSSIMTLYLIIKEKEACQYLSEVIIEKDREKLQFALEKYYPSIYEIKCFTRDQFIIKILKGQ